MILCGVTLTQKKSIKLIPNGLIQKDVNIILSQSINSMEDQKIH